MPRILTTDELRRRQSEYLTAIQPYVKIQADLLGLQPFTMLRSPDGSMLRIINWDPKHKRMYDDAGELISYLRWKMLET